jgi:hypothetical protein
MMVTTTTICRQICGSDQIVSLMPSAAVVAQLVPEISVGFTINNRQLRRLGLVTVDSNPYILRIVWQRYRGVVFPH